MALLDGPSTIWNPLDGPPLDDWIPDRWIGPHVGLRLCDGFKTLSQMPTKGGSSGSCWPAYMHEYVDLVAQEQSDLDAKDKRQASQNVAKLRPTSLQISRMNLALCWAGTYLDSAEQRRIVQRVALLRSRELDIEQISRRLRMSLHMLRKMNRNALDRIAVGLRRDRVDVF